MIILRLENKVIELNTHDVEGRVLYKAQDLLYGYGYDRKKTNNTLSNWKISMESRILNKSSENQGDLIEQGDLVKTVVKLGVSIKTGENSKRGTYLTKRQLLKLAGYVSYEFEDAVYEAFELLSEGDVAKASNVVESVAISKELMDKAICMENLLKKAILDWGGEKERTIQSKNICIRKHIISKTLTGNNNIKELREMFNGKNFVESLKNANSKVGLIAFIETVNIIIPMLEANLSYYVIRDMINKMAERWNSEDSNAGGM